MISTFPELDDPRISHADVVVSYLGLLAMQRPSRCRNLFEMTNPA